MHDFPFEEMFFNHLILDQDLIDFAARVLGTEEIHFFRATPKTGGALSRAAKGARSGPAPGQRQQLTAARKSGVGVRTDQQLVFSRGRKP